MARSRLVAAASLFAAARIMLAAREKVDINNLITGTAAFLDYRGIKPGGFRKITVGDLPEPFATPSANNAPSVIARPANAWPQAPAGFQVDLYATGLDLPREIRTAPNGDCFVAESDLGQIKIFRGRDKDGKPEQASVFATGLQTLRHFLEGLSRRSYERAGGVRFLHGGSAQLAREPRMQARLG